jgi:Uma2 family endonuclease
MSSLTHPVLEPTAWPVLRPGTPIMYEDEEVGEMGEVNQHVGTNETFHICVKDHLKRYHPQMRVFANMNCYYAAGPEHERTHSAPYVSPDNMVVEAFEELSEDTRSYTIGTTGPQPRLAMESLSEGTAEKNDLDFKVTLYADLKIPEYILVDVTGDFLPKKLLLKRLQPDGTWKDEIDDDGGVTSALDFRLKIDETGELIVIDNITGRRYEKPQDAVALVPLLEEKAHTAETKASRAIEARKLAESRARQEADARKLAEERAQQEAVARRLAEERTQQEADARRLAVERALQETEARRVAEEQRRVAEDRALALQAELDRLRSKQKDA